MEGGKCSNDGQKMPQNSFENIVDASKKLTIMDRFNGTVLKVVRNVARS